MSTKKDFSSLSDINPPPYGGEETTVKILSLNVWGIVGISKNRKERLDALGQILAFEETDFDYVFLQEMWSTADYEKLASIVKHHLPFGHYFHSGVAGSGVCLLSRWPIIDIFSHKYNLNGYAHKILHGDWFGGKVVGMAKVRHRSMIANLYVTHLHAEYDRKEDTYLCHRVSQAFEFSQFVSHTSLGSCDYSIVAGDLNTQSTDLPYSIILYNSRLKDSYFESVGFRGDAQADATSGNPKNSYTTKNDLKAIPNGQRIDYVMFGEGTANVSMECERYETPSWKTTSGLSISDHEPVVSVLRINKTLKRDEVEDPMAFVNFFNDDNLQCRIDALRQSADLMDRTLDTLRLSRLFFLTFAGIIFVLLLASISLDFVVEGTMVVLLHIVRIVMSLFLGFYLLMGLLWNAMERRSIMSTKEALDSLLKFLVIESEASIAIG